eukprot:gene11335-13854_t
MTLKTAGYDVLEGVDGKDALTQLDGRKVHLIISDVNMPNMDGITFLRKIMEQCPVPVVMCSSLTEEGSETLMHAPASSACISVPEPSSATDEHMTTGT